MANESAAKKRILVISSDSEYGPVVQSLNRGLNNYQLEKLPSTFGSIEKIVEEQLRKINYDGFLVDEMYTDSLPKIKQKGKKVGVIRWGERYEGKMKEIMTENKIVRFGARSQEEIEKELDAIFS